MEKCKNVKCTKEEELKALKHVKELLEDSVTGLQRCGDKYNLIPDDLEALDVVKAMITERAEGAFSLNCNLKVIINIGQGMTIVSLEKDGFPVKECEAAEAVIIANELKRTLDSYINMLNNTSEDGKDKNEVPETESPEAGRGAEDEEGTRPAAMDDQRR